MTVRNRRVSEHEDDQAAAPSCHLLHETDDVRIFKPKECLNHDLHSVPDSSIQASTGPGSLAGIRRE
jgi:hypothetical protein